MLTLKSLIEAVEKAKVIHRCDDGWDHNLVDADILIQELKKLDSWNCYFHPTNSFHKLNYPHIN